MAMTLSNALLLLGGAVLLALALQAWWKTRRAQPRQIDDSAGGDQRVEPGLGAGPEAGPDTIPDLSEDSPSQRQLHRRTPRLDALIDALVPLALDAPISGELALQHLPATRRAGSKPFAIEGLDCDSGSWEPFAPGCRYSELQAGVQLANRSGALNEIEYSEFLQIVEAFAESVGASPDVPDMLEVVARARELDGLAAPLDAQLSITLRSNGVAWSVAFVQQVAARLGLVSGAMPGRWVLAAAEEGAPPMLMLSVDSQAALSEDPQRSVVRECVLSLDVPQTSSSVEPFPAWHLLGKKLADDMDASLIDDQGQALSLHAFDAIGKEIDELYRRLEQLDLAAGSPAARRLFS